VRDRDYYPDVLATVIAQLLNGDRLGAEHAIAQIAYTSAR